TSPVQTNDNTTEQQQQLSLYSEDFKILPLPPLSPLFNVLASSNSSSMSSTTKDIDHLNTVFIAILTCNIDEDAIRQALSSADQIK
ncbi:unnamed protein product, partial [Rotaria sp. Silwood2]